MGTASEDYAAAKADMDRLGNELRAAGERLRAAANRMSEEARAAGHAAGVTTFHGDGFSSVNVGGLVIEEAHGLSVSRGEVQIGMEIKGGKVRTCHNCHGTQGWRVVGGVYTHIACGARQ